MAVRAKSNRKDPRRHGTYAQFGLKGAPEKAGALSVLMLYVRA